MNFLFVHQNMPGQYRELLQWLAQAGGQNEKALDIARARQIRLTVVQANDGAVG